MIRVALAGAGRMGSLHARNLAASGRLELTAIVDHSPERAASLASAMGCATASLDEVFDDPTTHGVVAACSTDALLEVTSRSLQAGKSVLCEKPLSLAAEALEKALPRLEGSGTPPLLVGFNRRFDPHFAALKERLDAGEIGALETLHLINHDPAPPAASFIPRSGGLFKDFTVHDFDTAAWLLAEPIVSVFAAAECLIDPLVGELGDWDTAKLILATASGRLCVISNSRRSGCGYDQRIEAFGSRGALRVGNLRTSAVELWREQGGSAAPIEYAFPDRYAEAYRRELDHFADMIEKDEPPRTGAAAALRAIRLAEAAARSAKTGRTVSVEPERVSHA